MAVKAKRPKITSGLTEKRKLGCGSLYVTVNEDKNGYKPIEVMVSLGKAGSCTKCQNEALTRMITIGLKYDIPVDVIIEELKDLECPNKNLWPESDRNLSCADAIAQVLRTYVENHKV